MRQRQPPAAEPVIPAMMFTAMASLTSTFDLRLPGAVCTTAKPASEAITAP